MYRIDFSIYLTILFEIVSFLGFKVMASYVVSLVMWWVLIHFLQKEIKKNYIILLFNSYTYSYIYLIHLIPYISLIEGVGTRKYALRSFCLCSILRIRRPSIIAFQATYIESACHKIVRLRDLYYVWLTPQSYSFPGTDPDHLKTCWRVLLCCE